MPWRLILFIFFFAIILLFIMLNLENKCDINFGFKKVPEVPVFLTTFSSFILGMLCAFPFILGFRSRKKIKIGKKPDKKPGKGPVSPGIAEENNDQYGID